MRSIVLFLTLLCFSSCMRVSSTIEPALPLPCHPKQIEREKRICLRLPADFSLSPFLPLCPAECTTDWGKEFHIALSFAHDFDLYRAITGFKRALFLLPLAEGQRRLEIEYCVALAYFLGNKYDEALYAVESSELICVSDAFPAYRDLLLILWESYQQLGKVEHAAHIFQLIEMRECKEAEKLALLEAVRRADFTTLHQFPKIDPHYGYLERMLGRYESEKKSVAKAQIANALLPGSGYWYVGLKQTAVTAFTVNALFCAAAGYFFCNNNWPAGVITLSLESGWYFGGITGAGLAAKSYNEQLYCTWADKIAQKENFFPSLMLKYSF